MGEEKDNDDLSGYIHIDRTQNTVSRLQCSTHLNLNANVNSSKCELESAGKCP